MSRTTEAHPHRSFAAPPSAAPGWAAWQHASPGARGSALALLAVAACLPALAGGFVWDDWIFVAEPLIRRWDGLVSIWLSPTDIRDEHHYWPIVYSTFWLEHKLWGFHAAGYHAVNLLLHAVNTLLVWRLLRRLEIPGAWLAGALFAVHPVHVESVAWIIERKDLLSALFYLWAVQVWLRYTETLALRRLVLCLALFTAAMLSKSIAVTLPAALLLLTWWRTGTITWREVGRLLPFFAVAAGITAADLFFYWSQSRYHFDYSAVERALIAARALWVYLAQLAWPASLPILYPRWEVSAGDPAGWAAVLSVCALSAALWHGRRRLGRGPFAALAFFVLTLSPVLGFLDYSFLRIAFLADRFGYLASIGPIALVAGAVAQSMTRLRGKGQAAAMAALLGTVSVLCAQTWRQAEAYRDDLTLAQHISAANPEHHFGQLLLAHALVGAGRHQEALTAARSAVRLAEGDRGADLGGAVSAAGSTLLADDRAAQAEEAFRRAVAIRPENSGERLNLARTLVLQARYEDGLSLYRELTREDCLNDLAHTGQAEAMLQAGNLPAARDAFLQALPLARDPRSEPVFHRRLGEVLHRMGQLDAAAEHLDRSLELNPRGVRTLLARAAVEAERNAPVAIEAERSAQVAIEAAPPAAEAAREIHAADLARIRHQLPAADADALALPGRAPSSRFDVLSSTPASSSGPRDQAGRRLDALTTKVGDGCGLEEARRGQPALERDVPSTEPGGDQPDAWITTAREIVEAAIEREPDRADARLLLATILQQSGEHRPAIAALEAALAASPNRATARQAHRLMGEILEARAQPDKAADHYRSALAIYPLDADALERLAAIHFQAGHYEKALPLYRRLARVTPCNTGNLKRLTETQTRLGGGPRPALGDFAPSASRRICETGK